MDDFANGSGVTATLAKFSLVSQVPPNSLPGSPLIYYQLAHPKNRPDQAPPISQDTFNQKVTTQHGVVAHVFVCARHLTQSNVPNPPGIVLQR